MKFFLLTVFAVLAAFVSAAPKPVDSLHEILARSDLYARNETGSNSTKNCLNDKRAQQVATNFRNLIANYSASLADATLTTDFTDYSDSVIELIDGGCPNGTIPLGSPTFTSRAMFEAGQSGQPPIPFEQLNIWHTCHQVIIRWRSAQSPEIVTGIIVFETVPAPAGSKYKDLIKLVYSEFNSGAWLVNLGVFKPSC